MSSSYELPSSVPEEDVLVLQNILTALESLGHGRDSTQTKKEGGGEDGLFVALDQFGDAGQFFAGGFRVVEEAVQLGDDSALFG